MKKFSLLLSFVLAAGVAVAAPQGTATTAPAKKTASAKATVKTHQVNAEFVSYDAAKKSLTLKTDAGEQTSPVQGKALTSVKAFKAGDKVVVTCKDKADGTHEATIAIKKAPAAPAVK
jgi:hypothetical protein